MLHNKFISNTDHLMQNMNIINITVNNSIYIYIHYISSNYKSLSNNIQNLNAFEWIINKILKFVKLSDYRLKAVIFFKKELWFYITKFKIPTILKK